MLFPQAKSALRPGALLAGKYRLSHLLGRGASGVVWSAVNTSTSRRVALKLLLKPEPTQRERLLREARAAGSLEHPNVVDVYDVTSLDDGSPVLVLELLEGQSLQKLLDSRGPIPEREAATIGRDIACALAVAHRRGIVHRDLKPANIFLHDRGEDQPVVKVVDFGISKNILKHEGTLTEAGTTVGSPAFMSPEQVRGERDLDGRTDLWALGVILWEMLAGQRLFDGRTHEVLKQVLSAPIKPLDRLVPGMDPGLSRLVHGLLERDAGKRLASAGEVARRLSAIAGLPEPPSSRSSPARSGVSGASGARPETETRDATVKPHKMTEPNKPGALPKVYTDDDDDDDEATHVAPPEIRRALAQQTVPKIFEDDEDDAEQTRVAADNELTAAIVASRASSPDSRAESRPEDVPTVRPPAPSADDLEPGAEAPATAGVSGSEPGGVEEATPTPAERPTPTPGERPTPTPRPATAATRRLRAARPSEELDAGDQVVASGPRRKAARSVVAAEDVERTPFWVWATVLLIMAVVALMMFKDTG